MAFFIQLNASNLKINYLVNFVLKLSSILSKKNKNNYIDSSSQNLKIIIPLPNEEAMSALLLVKL
ncbi:MAG: hypothetical protein ACTTJI_09005 [Capnocytophaga sp.]|uniref:hypothetical protein n=1 Tax=Capnocytophaga sp. TaxID=44737 RepID=UPI003FA004F3